MSTRIISYNLITASFFARAYPPFYSDLGCITSTTTNLWKRDNMSLEFDDPSNPPAMIPNNQGTFNMLHVGVVSYAEEFFLTHPWGDKRNTREAIVYTKSYTTRLDPFEAYGRVLIPADSKAHIIKNVRYFENDETLLITPDGSCFEMWTTLGYKLLVTVSVVGGSATFNVSNIGKVSLYKS